MTIDHPGNRPPRRLARLMAIAALPLVASACDAPDLSPAPCGEIAFGCGGLDVVASAGVDIDASLDPERDTATIQLDASRSFSRQDLLLDFVWTSAIDGTELATGKTPTIELPEGTHFVRLTVTDSMGATATDDVRVTVTTQQPLAQDILCGSLGVPAMMMLAAFFATTRLYGRADGSR